MYKALYRKWRPMSFADVVGQSHITGTLKNEVAENKIGHAYLFTGTRGTGKTTCAKILAKAINCKNSKGGDPCNECEYCRGINDGSITDVIEIDAASNNKVDDIRDILDKVVFPPVILTKKVYIIDEVHMLTTSAFNAMLKTLEEPPEHIVFVFATTEINKIPATVLSRCQRFDFKRIPVSLINQQLMKICDSEGIGYQKDALRSISLMADGALRDALSMLDKCALSGDEITEESISEMLGATDNKKLFGIIRYFAQGDIPNCLSLLSNIYSFSKDMTVFCNELVTVLRNLLIVKTAKEGALDILECTSSEYDEYCKLAEIIGLERIIYSIDILNETISKMTRSANKRVETEIALLKLCNPALSDNTNALVARIERLESGAVTPARTVKVKETKEHTEPETETENNTADKEPPKTQSEISFFPEILESIKKTGNMMVYSLLKSASARSDGDNLVIYTSNLSALSLLPLSENLEIINNAVYNITGKNMKVSIREKSSKKAQKDDAFADFIKNNNLEEI